MIKDYNWDGFVTVHKGVDCEFVHLAAGRKSGRWCGVIVAQMPCKEALLVSSSMRLQFFPMIVVALVIYSRGIQLCSACQHLK